MTLDDQDGNEEIKKKKQNEIILIIENKIFLYLDEDEDGEILSSSTTSRLWKTAFARRNGQQFLDICLLKKAYMKALEDMTEGDDDSDKETVSTVLNTIVDQAVENDDDDDDEQNNDNLGLAARIAKRSLTSTTNIENDQQQMKRLRSTQTSTTVPV